MCVCVCVCERERERERWRRHFTQVLNIHSQVDASEIEQAAQRPLRPYMDNPPPPNEDELIGAIAKFKSGKAPGQSGVLSEMIKAASCNSDFLGLLLNLMHTGGKARSLETGKCCTRDNPKKGRPSQLRQLEGDGTDPSGKVSGSGRGSPA